VISELDPAGRSRRTFLVGAAALSVTTTGAVLAGCSAPNRPGSPQQPGNRGGDGSGGAGSTPSPPPDQPSVPVFPGAIAGAKLEDSLAVRASTVLAAGHRVLGKQGRALVAAIRDQHRAHAAALRTTDPTNPAAEGAGPGPTPSGTPSGSSIPTPSFSKAVDRLVAAESKAAVIHRAAATSSRGLSALLWGSLATSAASLAGILAEADLAGDDPDPGAVSVAPVRGRAPMPVVDVIAAEQEMVRQLHAVIYGYQLALGRLGGARRDTAAAELRRHRILRDRLTARLLDRKAEVPVAGPAYVPSTVPRNATTAGKLIRQMETALVPFCGLWVAASGTPSELAEALHHVDRTGRVARQWGASLPAWPGWKPA
jgi:hypothetical protein